MWFGSWDGTDGGGGPGGTGGSCGPSSCGVGGWSGPLPGDPSNNSILTATPAFGGIDVNWSLPTTNSFAVAHTNLYRGLTSDFGSAILLKEVKGTFWHDRLEAGLRYYYWINIVSVNGTVGELIGPASAVAKPLIEGMVELLTARIDNGLLATTLKNQLDQISILNANLLNEVFDRETGETSLAAAMADVAAGVAEAHTFILDEINTRATQNAAIAESINGVVATLGDDIAATIVTMTASIDSLTGDVYAMLTAKVTVNGLVGGFGIINDGISVEAGFDVDTFWVGRTSADKRKPFIIDGGVVYIDEGAINKLTFSKLRDESGSFIVENGKVKANYLDTIDLTVKGEILGGGFTSHAWPATGVSGFYLGPNGLRLGNRTDGKYFEATSSGNIYAPGLTIEDGQATFSGKITAGSIDLTKLSGMSQVLTADGTFTVPEGMTSMTVTVKGAGGGGGASFTSGNEYNGITVYPGGTGGRGGLYKATYSVSPGQVFTAVIGLGGAAGVAGSGTTTSFEGTGVSAVATGGSVGGDGGEGGTNNGTPGTGGGSGGTGLGSFGGISNMPGQNGVILIEAFNPNSVVGRQEYALLLQHLNERFPTYTWP